MNLYHTGKNVVQTITNRTSDAYVEKYTNWSGGMIGGWPHLTGYWKTGTYTFSMDIELAAVNNRVVMIFKKASDQNWYYISNGVFVKAPSSGAGNAPFTTESTGDTTKHIIGTITIPEDVDEIRLGYWDYNNKYRYYNLMIELGSTASDYEPYQGNTYLIQLGGTYYGATLDVTSGKLSVTHANIASYNGEQINEPWLSSMDKYVAGATPTTGAQVVYPLTTPIEIDLTPTQINSLLGSNNIWHDGNGDIELKFKETIQDWLDQM